MREPPGQYKDQNQAKIEPTLILCFGIVESELRGRNLVTIYQYEWKLESEKRQSQDDKRMRRAMGLDGDAALRSCSSQDTGETRRLGKTPKGTWV